MPHRYKAVFEFGCFKSGGPRCRTDTRQYSSLGALNLVVEDGCLRTGSQIRWPKVPPTPPTPPTPAYLLRGGECFLAEPCPCESTVLGGGSREFRLDRRFSSCFEPGIAGFQALILKFLPSPGAPKCPPDTKHDSSLGAPV